MGLLVRQRRHVTLEPHPRAGVVGLVRVGVETRWEVPGVVHLYPYRRKVWRLGQQIVGHGSGYLRVSCGQLIKKLVDVGSDELDLGHRALERYSHIYSFVPAVAMGLEVDLLPGNVGILMVLVTDVVSGSGHAD